MRTVWIATIIAVSGVVPAAEEVIANDSCEAKRVQLEAELATLRQEHSTLAASQFNLLEELWSKLEAESGVPDYVVEMQRRYGWADPIAMLTADLTSKPELIPEGTNMERHLAWGSMKVLSPRWVLASFTYGSEDAGAVLLEYRIDSERRVSWERLKVASVD